MGTNAGKVKPEAPFAGSERAQAVVAAVGLAVTGLAALVVSSPVPDALTYHNYIGRIASIVAAFALALYAARRSVTPAGLLTASGIALVLSAGGSLVLLDGSLAPASVAIREAAGMAGDVGEVLLAVFFLAALARQSARVSAAAMPLALAGSHLLFLATLLVPGAALGAVKFASLLVGMGLGLMLVRGSAPIAPPSSSPAVIPVPATTAVASSAFRPLPLREILPLMAGTALFPLLFVLIAHLSDLAEVRASMFAPSVEVATIVALVVLALATRLMKRGVSMAMTFLVPMPFFVTAMTLLPLFWGSGLFVFGIAIKCGYLLYNALLWMMVAKLAEGAWQRALALFALVTASTELFALVGRNAAAGMLGVGLAERDVVVYVALAAVWLLSMGLIAFFLLDRRREKERADAASSGGRSSDAEPTCAPSVPQEAADPFKGKCARCAERFGLSERESEIMAEFARGRSADYLAKQLFISKETVKTHLKRIYAKCDVHSRQELLDVIESCECAPEPSAVAAPPKG